MSTRSLLSKRAWLLGLTVVLLTASTAEAQRGGRGGGNVTVSGYTTKNGTYVAPHMRSQPDGNSLNNWSTRGNVNPYTGKPGTKPPHPSSGAPGVVGYGSGSAAAPSAVGPAAGAAARPGVPGEPVQDEEDAVDRDEAIASAKLSLWKQLIELDKKELAKFRLQDLIRDYPNTKAAVEAKELLKKM